MVDEPVARDPDDADRQVAVGRVGETGLLEEPEHRAAEPAGGNALLEGDHESLAASLVEDQLTIERLGEPGVDHADGPALGLERVGRLDRPRHDRPEADEQQVAPSRSTSPCPMGSARGSVEGRPKPASRG